jgi:hypothetical protein
MRRLIGHAVTDLTLTRREVVFRFRSAGEFVEVFREYYGPSLWPSAHSTRVASERCMRS